MVFDHGAKRARLVRLWKRKSRFLSAKTFGVLLPASRSTTALEPIAFLYLPFNSSSLASKRLLDNSGPRAKIDRASPSSSSSSVPFSRRPSSENRRRETDHDRCETRQRKTHTNTSQKFSEVGFFFLAVFSPALFYSFKMSFPWILNEEEKNTRGKEKKRNQKPIEKFLFSRSSTTIVRFRRVFEEMTRKMLFSKGWVLLLVASCAMTRTENASATLIRTDQESLMYLMKHLNKTWYSTTRRAPFERACEWPEIGCECDEKRMQDFVRVVLRFGFSRELLAGLPRRLRGPKFTMSEQSIERDRVERILVRSFPNLQTLKLGVNNLEG